MRNIIKLFGDTSGLAGIDYALGLALIAIVSITAWGAIGSQPTMTTAAATIVQQG